MQDISLFERQCLDPPPQLLERTLLLAALHQHAHSLDTCNELVLPFPLTPKGLEFPLQIADPPLVLGMHFRLKVFSLVFVGGGRTFGSLLTNRMRVLLQLAQLFPREHVASHARSLFPNKLLLCFL
jgi:hypothetical protein